MSLKSMTFTKCAAVPIGAPAHFAKRSIFQLHALSFVLLFPAFGFEVSAAMQSLIEKDKRLRARVKMLGNILGQVIREQSGEEVFNAVETLRTGFREIIDKKTHVDEGVDVLRTYIASRPCAMFMPIIRAYSIYFSLVNVAESISSINDVTRKKKARRQNLVRAYSAHFERKTEYYPG